MLLAISALSDFHKASQSSRLTPACRKISSNSGLLMLPWFLQYLQMLEQHEHPVSRHGLALAWLLENVKSREPL